MPFVISLMQLLTYRDGTRKVISGKDLEKWSRLYIQDDGSQDDVSHCGGFSNSSWYLDEESGQSRQLCFLEPIWEAIEACVVMIIYRHHVDV